MATEGEQPREPLVIISRRRRACAGCGDDHEPGGFLTMDDAGPLCMDCADFGQLDFLPRGDTALTRRARKASKLSVVVVEWSRTRKRYERQGVLAEPDAIDQAEQDCLADAELRERRREREVERRATWDEQFATDLAAAIRLQFPGCPADRAEQIARHTGQRGSGRIGRTGAGRALDPEAVRLAVAASVRHVDTDYDEFLMLGTPRDEARSQIRDAVDRILTSWHAG